MSSPDDFAEFRFFIEQRCHQWVSTKTFGGDLAEAAVSAWKRAGYTWTRLKYEFPDNKTFGFDSNWCRALEKCRSKEDKIDSDVLLLTTIKCLERSKIRPTAVLRFESDESARDALKQEQIRRLKRFENKLLVLSLEIPSQNPYESLLKDNVKIAGFHCDPIEGLLHIAFNKIGFKWEFQHDKSREKRGFYSEKVKDKEFQMDTLRFLNCGGDPEVIQRQLRQYYPDLLKIVLKEHKREASVTFKTDEAAAKAFWSKNERFLGGNCASVIMAYKETRRRKSSTEIETDDEAKVTKI